MKNLYQVWKRRSLFEKAIIILAAWYIWNYVSTYFKSLKNSANAAADAAGSQVVANNYSISIARVAVLNGQAIELQIALWDWQNSWLFGWRPRWTEDEDSVITIINSCESVNEVKYLADRYRSDGYPSDLPTEKKLTLKASIEKLLSSSEQAEIKAVYRAALR